MSESLKVAFFATMSAGKTTCINALLGTEVLHSANEATTATITTIYHSEHSKVSAYDDCSNLVYEEFEINVHAIQQLNATEYIENIYVQSNFDISENLKIIDTPGPNNSMDAQHMALAYRYLDNGNIDYAIYLINATQPFINDDLEYLKYLSQKMERERIIFLVNKIDKLDFEIDSIDNFINDLRSYLKNIGFTQPFIVLGSGYNALILKKLAKNELLTRKEKRDVLQLIDSYGELNLNHNYFPQELRQQVILKNYFKYLGEDFKDKDILNKIYCQTGFPYLEEYISQCIQKHM